jgi:methylthioribose-1-phosphate isomerase
MYLAAREAAEASFDADLRGAAEILKNTRPTASNLAWAVDSMLAALTGRGGARAQKIEAARLAAEAIADGDAEACRNIGLHGLELIRAVSRRKNGEAVNILTHCNAGWLAFVDYGTALSPVYAAFDAGIPVHVWVDETRPRNQGAALTAWELGVHGVPHDLIPDNAGGHLMQHGMVDLVITGADRVTRRGDAANKIGTYLKAAAAKENGVPFYVALPSSTFDWNMSHGVREIPIEERDAEEVRRVTGKTADGRIETVLICPGGTPARNWGFDVTPARYVTGLITERGVAEPSEQGILKLYPEHSRQDEGYVKYSADHTEAPARAAEFPLWEELDEARTRLYDLGLIGALPNGIGFGNVSVRVKDGEFLVSGTATGDRRVLGPGGYCAVTAFDIEKNRVTSSGPVKASSESMSHGAIYRACPASRAVIHIHSRKIFDGMLRDNYPRTPADVPYGTPEMARAIIARVKERGQSTGVIVMAGHDEGVIAYGASVKETLDPVLELYYKYT